MANAFGAGASYDARCVQKPLGPNTMQITAIRVDSFKRLKSVEVALSDVTILIGANNSGKSSILQGIHVAITALQSAGSLGAASTLGVDQLIFKPSTDPMILNHGTPMSSKAGPEITFTYVLPTNLDAPRQFRLKMRRGKNANIAVTYSPDDPFYRRASDRTRPLSIFVPGLAGVALREERRTDAIIATGIAQGDANLYLRNVLLRLIKDPAKLDRFHAMIGEIFPSLRIEAKFDEALHHHIEILVHLDRAVVPLELVGTGALQVIQLVAYATMYDPGLLLLDEPDAHLHPSNQRILAATLLKIAEQGTRIILATHSRHIFDSLARSSLTGIVWLKEGACRERKPTEDLSMLLDLGALDSFEMLGQGRRKVVVLTEDTKTDRLRFLLEANGFPVDGYLIQPFNGVDNIKMCAAVADFFVRQGNDTHVLIHRDSDGLLPDEVTWCRENEKSKNELPERTELFFTPFTDIEHQFCQAAHVATALEIPLPDAEAIIDRILAAENLRLTVKFTQKRNDLKLKILRGKENVPSTETLVGTRIAFEQAKGKTLFGLMHQEVIREGRNPAHLTSKTSAALVIEQLKGFAARVWPASPQPDAGPAPLPPTPANPT